MKFKNETKGSTNGEFLWNILLNKKESVFARFDFAFNNEGGTGFYIRINDAF
jgi:hypothetical protein